MPDHPERAAEDRAQARSRSEYKRLTAQGVAVDPPAEDRALEAAAREIVHTIIYGTIHTSEEQAVVAIMRRHGLRGPPDLNNLPRGVPHISPEMVADGYEDAMEDL